MSTTNSFPFQERELSEKEVLQLLSKLADVTDELARVIVGQREVVQQLLVAMLAGGHCLLEGAPGLAKTLMVSSLAKTLELDYKRIQFTPDLMPSDIIGTEILETDHDSGTGLNESIISEVYGLTIDVAGKEYNIPSATRGVFTRCRSPFSYWPRKIQ